MKKIILFEDLNKTSFYFCLLLIPFFKKVYFREASYAKKNTFFKKNLNKIFFQIGLEDLNGSKANKSFALKKFLVKKYINSNFKIDFFNKFSEFIGIQDKKKTIYCLENHVYTSDILVVEASSYICIKNYFVNDCVYYVPSTKKTFLTISEIQNERLKVVSLPILIGGLVSANKEAFKIIFKGINIFYKNICNNSIKNKKNVVIKGNECEIGFFPHEGLKYGNFFKKTFFYSAHAESPLYKKNIDTLSFRKFDKLTQRYLNFYKLRHTELGELSKEINLNNLFSYIIFFFKNRNFVHKNKLINFIIFLEIYLSIKKYNNFFKDKKYKFLFFYNDFLNAPTILLSASINKIKTISFQDRLSSYFYYHRCFFDLYLLAGQKFKKIFENKYAIKNYQVLGLTRSNLISLDKNFSLNSIKNKKNHETIACLLLGCRADWNVSLYGQDGTSAKSILDFCQDIRELSSIVKDKFYIIKFKDIDLNKNAELITSIRKIISKSNNLTLITNDNISSAKLVAHSVLTIGKYSTIMDEALIAGTNVLIHDPEHFVSTLGFYRKNKFLIANNFEELLFKTNSILEGKNQFSKHYEEEKNLYVKNYLTDNGAIGNQKKIIQLLENYIQ